ncbi:MAG TPA: dihydropteroate synthase [Planctomycetes bacterium]|nr:dihydropteroate synthase [Planctomycetota bacterium]
MIREDRQDPRPSLFEIASAHGRTLELGPSSPRIMGILNLTPDSFSDGGKLTDPEKACEEGLRMVQEGADILDLGAESTRPGADPVSASEELARLLPVLRLLRERCDAVLSIDTTKSEVAEAALAEGADWINDVSALRRDPKLGRVVAESGAALVLMHSRGTPRNMQEAPFYRDPLREVLAELGESLRRAEEDYGIDPRRLLVDPGIGFAKRPADNLALLRNLRALGSLGRPVLLGLSRKSTLNLMIQLHGKEAVLPKNRDAATAAATAIAHGSGVSVHRVHSVGYAFQALAVARGLGLAATTFSPTTDAP